MEMNNFGTEAATKQDVAVALKNTAKGRLTYDTAVNCSFDSLQVCYVTISSGLTRTCRDGFGEVISRDGRLSARRRRRDTAARSAVNVNYLPDAAMKLRAFLAGHETAVVQSHARPLRNV